MSDKRLQRMVRRICRKEARKQFKKFSRSVVDLLGCAQHHHRPQPPPPPPPKDDLCIDDLIRRIQSKIDVCRDV